MHHAYLRTLLLCNGSGYTRWCLVYWVPVGLEQVLSTPGSSYYATEYGSHSDETGQTEAQCHMAPKGYECRAEAQTLQPFISNGTSSREISLTLC